MPPKKRWVWGGGGGGGWGSRRRPSPLRGAPVFLTVSPSQASPVEAPPTGRPLKFRLGAPAPRRLLVSGIYGCGSGRPAPNRETPTLGARRENPAPGICAVFPA